MLVPNRVEAEWGTGRKIRNPEDAIAASRDLLAQFGHDAVVLKVDRDGILLADRSGIPIVLPTRPREVCDVTGAGDMVAAVLGLCLASGIDMQKAAALANVAAGLEVERLGVVQITRREICAEMARCSAEPLNKLVSLERMTRLAERYRHEGKSVVFTNGCFDLLHVGHVNYLLDAAQKGDVLVVAVNSDASVRRLKGVSRPVISQDNRASLISALGCVDHVLIFDEDTPRAVLREIRPDVLVKGGTYRIDEVIGREIVEEYGGRVCVTGTIDGISTTAILRKAVSITPQSGALGQGVQ